MNQDGKQGMAVTAIGTALLMHILLFLAAKPSNVNGLVFIPSPPETNYAMPTAEGAVEMVAVRMIKSPTLFSLPSELGFSRELKLNDVQNKKTITPLQVHSESFHTIDFGARENGKQLHPRELMISETQREAILPSGKSLPIQPRMGAKRIYLSPELERRLMGSVELPPDLVMPADQPWTVRASVHVSAQGAVEHVMLEQPLDSPSLNQQVLQMIYKLRFTPGDAVDSSLEIYSPEPERLRGEVE